MKFSQRFLLALVAALVVVVSTLSTTIAASPETLHPPTISIRFTEGGFAELSVPPEIGRDGIIAEYSWWFEMERRPIHTTDLSSLVCDENVCKIIWVVQSMDMFRFRTPTGELLIPVIDQSGTLGRYLVRNATVWDTFYTDFGSTEVEVVRGLKYTHTVSVELVRGQTASIIGFSEGMDSRISSESYGCTFGSVTCYQSFQVVSTAFSLGEHSLLLSVSTEEGPRTRVRSEVIKFKVVEGESATEPSEFQIFLPTLQAD